MVIVFAVFSLLTILTLLSRPVRQRMISRTGTEWWIDSIGLVMQGFVVPSIQGYLVYFLCGRLFPSLRGSVSLTPWVAVILNFVVVDYVFYWNHRLLHSPALWKIHALHHSGTFVDVLSTSRNVVWAPFFIAYLWVNGFTAYLLGDPRYFLLSASVTAALDLWRHSSFGLVPGSALHRALRTVLITPVEHHWHHSTDRPGVNFGANLTIWDRLHGTLFATLAWPRRYGSDPTPLTARRAFLP